MNKTLTLASLLVISLLVFLPSVHATEPPSLEIAVYMDCSFVTYMDIDDSEMILKGYGVGTFVMSGDFSDSGVATEPWWEVELDLETGTGELKGEVIFEGTEGTLEISFEGALEPIAEGTYCEGEWTIISGTGSYDGLSGEGWFETVTDMEYLATGTYIGLED